MVEDLVEKLGRRGSEMQQLLATFTGEVERPLSTTERRAREMTASVGEHVAENAKAITEQFEKIRGVAEGEREQTTRSAALRLREGGRRSRAAC